MEGYLQGPLWKELLVAPFVEHFKTATLGKSYWYILTVLGTILKYCISAEFLLMEGYGQGALRKDLLIAPFVEQSKTTTLGRSQWYHVSVLRTKYPSIAFLPSFFWQEKVQGVLRKERLIAPFVERFQTSTLRNSYWYILPVLGSIYLIIAFLPNFCWWKVMYRELYEGSCLLLLS